ncbi:MAG: ATP-dependent helicase [Candidatus Izemoplasmataceae bacterium]|jgi:DNA helicase II / ATP-dependent DNA helicase PcrA|uniref:ATP-dependent helicase n=1 Tax=Liberiplasma polymorphum TaxID=3374570 RepID=UPI0037752192
MNRLLKDLNEAQKEAVLTTEGPVMAIAGAGSGKTRVLTRRMAHLIFDLGIPYQNILAITFTNKAANEMKERIARLLDISTKTMWISTFHSMCSRILRTHIELLGYDKHFQIIDDDDTKQLIKLMLKRLNIDPKIVNPKMIKNHVLNVKSDPSLIDHYEEPLRGYLQDIYPAYQRHLKDNNLLDFEDLMVLTIKLLKENMEVRRYYQRQFQYVLVDEFQDTNNVQYELIRLLVNEDENIFIVGDEDQSIYAFRGANIDNIRKFNQDFENVKQILLEQNYRSTNTILKAANQVIKRNKNRIEKNLFSTRGDGELITFFKAYSHKDEAEYVAEMIKILTRDHYRNEDIAILYRANSMSRTFEETLMQRRISYQVVGNVGFFKRKEIKDMVAYLRLIINPNDDYSLTRVVNEPKRGIGAKTIENLMDYAMHSEMSMFDAISDAGNPLGPKAKHNLNEFKNIITTLKHGINETDIDGFIEYLLDLTGYREYLKLDEMGDIRLENILELKSLFQETERAIKDINKIELLTYVLEDIALQSQEDEIKDKNVVTLMTLHAAKGLEYQVVFMVGLEQGIFPLYQSLESPKDVEEERRLMYVGMTRAKDKLYLTNCQERLLYGEYRHHQDSMFIQDIDKDLIKLEGLNKAISHEQEQKRLVMERRQAMLNTVKENDINKGDKINHTVFGDGVVVSVSGDQCVIAFKHPHGIKTLLKNHIAITKI